MQKNISDLLISPIDFCEARAQFCTQQSGDYHKESNKFA